MSAVPSTRDVSHLNESSPTNLTIRLEKQQLFFAVQVDMGFLNSWGLTRDKEVDDGLE
jgi:hypothetical protein